jgi:hypothetical protein
MFPTICKINELVYHNPDELKNIIYRREYTINDIDRSGLFHPVKNMEIQSKFRGLLS